MISVELYSEQFYSVSQTGVYVQGQGWVEEGDAQVSADTYVIYRGSVLLTSQQTSYSTETYYGSPTRAYGHDQMENGVATAMPMHRTTGSVYIAGWVTLGYTDEGEVIENREYEGCVISAVGVFYGALYELPSQSYKKEWMRSIPDLWPPLVSVSSGRCCASVSIAQR